MSLYVLQTLLGHETPILTQRYLAAQGCAHAEGRPGRGGPIHLRARHAPRAHQVTLDT